MAAYPSIHDICLPGALPSIGRQASPNEQQVNFIGKMKISPEDTTVGNFSHRMSEILSMPTPKHKLQPILKPIVNNYRPKAAFKKRTPVMKHQSFPVKTSKKLNISQMLSFDNNLNSPVSRKESRLRQKLSRPFSSSRFLKSKRSFSKSRRTIAPLLLQRNSSRFTPTLLVEDHTTDDKNTDGNKTETVAGESHELDHIVQSTTSLETLSPTSISGHSSTKRAFPCLLYCSPDKNTTTSSSSTDKFQKKPKVKNRIMTLLELVAKRNIVGKDKSEGVRSPVLSSDSFGETCCGNNPKKDLYTFVDNGTGRNKSANFDNHEKVQLDADSQPLICEDFDYSHFNMNAENNISKKPSAQFPLTRSSEESLGFVRSSQRMMDRQMFSAQRRNHAR